MSSSGTVVIPLEVCAESAGRALACAFSSSDEYEAALIAERRAEGRYGSPYRRRHLMVVAAITAGLAVFALLIA